MKKTYLLNCFLAVLTALGLLIALLVKTFQPAVLLPALSVPNLVLISLAALLLDHFVNPGAARCYICIPVFSALSFGVLPLAAGLVSGEDALKLAVIGGVVFTVVTWLFSSMTERMQTGHDSKLAALAGALGIYLAAQCFSGMFF